MNYQEKEKIIDDAVEKVLAGKSMDEIVDYYVDNGVSSYNIDELIRKTQASTWEMLSKDFVNYVLGKNTNSDINKMDHDLKKEFIGKATSLIRRNSRRDLFEMVDKQVSKKDILNKIENAVFSNKDIYSILEKDLSDRKQKEAELDHKIAKSQLGLFLIPLLILLFGVRVGLKSLGNPQVLFLTVAVILILLVISIYMMYVRLNQSKTLHLKVANRIKNIQEFLLKEESFGDSTSS